MNAPPDRRSPLQRSPVWRREQLLLRSTALRLQFAREAGVLEAPLAVADRVHDGVRWLRGHPEVVLGGAVVVVVLRPRVAWRWAWRGWGAWRLWQGLRRRLGRPRPG